MASKRKKKINWRRAILFYIGTPLVIWLVAFLSWFFWQDLTNFLSRQKANTKQPAAASKTGSSPQKASRENITEEDRKKLDDIINRKN